MLHVLYLCITICLLYQVEAWQKIWSVGNLQRMWTKADAMHLHALSGAVYMLLGGLVLLDVAAVDLMTLNGLQAQQLLPSEALKQKGSSR